MVCCSMGVSTDKRNDGIGKPVVPEAFVPYTLALRMWTQILVRSDVPPLTLLRAIQQKVNSLDHDQQTNPRENFTMDQGQPEWARGT